MTYLGHRLVGVADSAPPLIRDAACKVPSPRRDRASLEERKRHFTDNYTVNSRAYHDAPGREVVHRLRKWVLDTDRPVVQCTRTRAEDGDRNDVYHEVAEKVKRFDGRLPFLILNDLEVARVHESRVNRERNKARTWTTLTTESLTSGWNWVR